jgi:hypothetical protein
MNADQADPSALKTAVLAGFATWSLAYALGGSFPVVAHLFRRGLTAVTTRIGLVETVVGALAGACRPEAKHFSQAAGR